MSRPPASRRPPRAEPAAVAERLRRAAAGLGVVLDAGAAARLVGFGQEILRWNRRVDLVGPIDLPGLAERHLLDALVLLPVLRAAGVRRLADVGSGAGLPGLALAAVEPALRVVSLEPRERRAAFQRHAVRALRLGNVDVVPARVEAVTHAPGGRAAVRSGADLPGGPVDAVVARAIAPLPRLLGLLAPLVAPGGRVLAMRGSSGAAEASAARRAAATAGLDLEREVRYGLGGVSGEAPRERVLLVYRARVGG